MTNKIYILFIFGLFLGFPLVAQDHFQCTDEITPSADLQDYGFRIYTPEIGRFVSVDTLSKGITPYNYIEN